MPSKHVQFDPSKIKWTPGLQARFFAMLQEQEDHQDVPKVSQKRKRDDDDSSDDNHESDDNGKTRGSEDDDNEEEVAQKYAWIGVEVPKPNTRNGASDRSGFSKKNVCLAMGIDEEKFHFIQVNVHRLINHHLDIRENWSYNKVANKGALELLKAEAKKDHPRLKYTEDDWILNGMIMSHLENTRRVWKDRKSDPDIALEEEYLQVQVRLAQAKRKNKRKKLFIEEPIPTRDRLPKTLKASRPTKEGTPAISLSAFQTGSASSTTSLPSAHSATVSRKRAMTQTVARDSESELSEMDDGYVDQTGLLALEPQITKRKQNATVPVSAPLLPTPIMPTQIVPAPAPVKKTKGVAHKDVRQWSGGPPEALVTCSTPERETTTTRDKPGHMRKGKVKAITELPDEGEGTQGGT